MEETELPEEKDTFTVCRLGHESAREGEIGKARHTGVCRVPYAAYTGTGERGPDFCAGGEDRASTRGVP